MAGTPSANYSHEKKETIFSLLQLHSSPGHWLLYQNLRVSWWVPPHCPRSLLYPPYLGKPPGQPSSFQLVHSPDETAGEKKNPKHEQDRSRALLPPWNDKLSHQKRNYFSYPNCSRVPVVPGTGPASFCAGPRPSPGLSVLGPEYPVSPWSLGWHNVHGLEVVVQTVQMPGKCQLLHQFLCGAPARGRDVLLNDKSLEF